MANDVKNEAAELLNEIVFCALEPVRRGGRMTFSDQGVKMREQPGMIGHVVARVTASSYYLGADALACENFE